MKFFNIAKKINSAYLIPGTVILGGVTYGVNENKKTEVYEKNWQDAGYKKIKTGTIDKMTWQGGSIGGGPCLEKYSIFAWKKFSDVGQYDEQPYDANRRNLPGK